MRPIKQMNITECLDALRAFGYSEEIDTPLNLADRIESLTRWIPVSERVPTQEDRDVLAWYATKYPFATLVNWYEFPLNNKDVTHWQRIIPPTP
jgi:hypothetical protein